MSPTPNRTVPWLPIGAAAVFLVAVVVLVLGLTSASGATSDRQDAESAVTVQRSAVEAAQRELSGAEAALQDARSDAADSRSNLDAVGVSLEEALSAKDVAEALLSEIRVRAPAFVSSAGEAIEHVEATTFELLELAAQQGSMIEAILAGDYRRSNDLYAAYLEPASAVAGDLNDLAARFDAFPDVPISDPEGYSGAAVRGRAPDDSLDLDPPTGPAVITVELPAEIPCTPRGDGGCQYAWTAEFIESNWLGVTIDRIGIRYRRGNMYCTIGYSDESVYEREWDDVLIRVTPNGTATTSNNLTMDPGDPCWPVRGGELLFRWEGTDAEGHRLSGRATAPLEPPG